MNETQAPKTVQWSVLAEVGIVVAMLTATKYVLSLWIWKFAGPVTLFIMLPVVTLICRARGTTWSDMGMKLRNGWKNWLLVVPQAIGVGVVFAIAVGVTLATVHFAGINIFESPEGVDRRWGDVEGNLGNYLLWMGIVWTAAAFGEEMFFRGYLISRIEAGLGKVRFGVIWAILVSSLLFGLGHYYYQGVRGLLVTGVIGLVFGTMFIVYRRNLWPLILWHGAVDSLTFTAMYMNWDI